MGIVYISVPCNSVCPYSLVEILDLRYFWHRQATHLPMALSLVSFPLSSCLLTIASSACRVMTVSFHKYGDFFPGTGALGDIGTGGGAGYSVNVPLQEGMDDESYRYVFEPIMTKVHVP
jgi:hypothetical protein